MQSVPLLRQLDIDRRKIWAEAVGMPLCKSGQHQKIIFSDEKKFQICKPSGAQYCWRRPGEELMPAKTKKTVKHGSGRIMVWGCVSYNGVGRLYRIDDILTGDGYCTILDSAFLPSLSDLAYTTRSSIFQQDNDPKHTSNGARKWLASHGVDVLEWPPNSPDMSIVEKVWDLVDNAI
jgi:hypothetical protein